MKTSSDFIFGQTRQVECTADKSGSDRQAGISPIACARPFRLDFANPWCGRPQAAHHEDQELEAA